MLKPMLFGSDLPVKSPAAVTVPPAGTFGRTYERMVALLLVLSTRSTFNVTGTGQLLVRLRSSEPAEKLAEVKEPKPPPPNTPKFVSAIAGNGAFMLCAAEIAVRFALFATVPRVIPFDSETLSTPMVPIEMLLVDGDCAGRVIRSFTLMPNTLSCATTNL